MSRLTQEIRSGRYGYNGNELQSESDIDRCWEDLQQICRLVSIRAPSLKYKDPAELKDLCKLRNLTGDVATRADVQSLITEHGRNRNGSLHFMVVLHLGTAWRLITYLRNRQTPKFRWEDCEVAYGGRQQARDALHRHVNTVYAPQVAMSMVCTRVAWSVLGSRRHAKGFLRVKSLWCSLP